jgi:sulfopyruvate decarboxylase TPP-binding subunit
MGAVDQDRAGTASGINNAVARVASLLAVAVLGIVLVGAFRHRLDSGLAEIPISSHVREQIEADSIHLAALRAPENLDQATRANINSLVQISFVFAFRVVVLICAALALVSAASAGWMIEPAARPATANLPQG